MTASRSRGQHAGLTAPAILEAAIRVVDRDGLAALSMRRLGAELGVEAMAIYHHFPNKEALLDGVVAALATEHPVPEFGAADWQKALSNYARARLETLTDHPHLVVLVMSRPAVTAETLQLMEALLGSLRTAGFPAGQSLDMIYALNELVLVHAALDAGVGEAPEPHREHGRTSRLSQLSAEAYPLIVEAARAEVEPDPLARFEFTLQAMLTGFAADRN